MDVKTLWNQGTESDWKAALAKYDDAPSVKRNPDISQRIESVKPSEIMGMDARKFYDFLFNVYFVWKYSAKNRLATTQKQLKKYEEEGMDELAVISCDLFRAYEHAPEDTKTLLKIAKRIKGLGTAGASGLLSILFPREYGTVDQFVVYALRKVDDLPEKKILDEMKPENLTNRDCVVLEEIYRRKARELNKKFGTTEWTPRMMDKILWSTDR